MHILLTCVECNYQEKSVHGKDLMHKIVMWNHVKKAHPHTAERIMRIYNTVPSELFAGRRVTQAAA